MILVSINCETSIIRRYECGGAKPRVTHTGRPPLGAGIDPANVEDFRVRPPLHLAVAITSAPPPPRVA